MKLVHINKDLLPESKLAEEAKELEKIIRSHPTNDRAYSRLMIIYRKLKEYKKELHTINTAIRVFENRFSEKKPVYGKNITKLSRAILKATGLADKKGNNIYEWGELGKWKKRKELLLKKK